MDGVTPNRLRAGALAWLLTLQFFVVEAIAAARFDGSYSYVDDVISDLGTKASAAAQLMNASFVLQAALILAGALLLRPALPGLSGRVAPVLLELAAAGVLMVGVFPSDGNSAAARDRGGAAPGLRRAGVDRAGVLGAPTFGGGRARRWPCSGSSASR